MLQFFLGEDEYQVRKSAAVAARNFIEKQNTNLNVNIFYGSLISADQLNSAILSAPFLGDRKLTILNNFLSENIDKKLENRLLDIVKNLPEFSDLIVTEIGKIDAKNSLYQYLEKNAEKKVFGAAGPVAVRKFVEKILAQADAKIDATAMTKLSYIVGADLWRLENETRKLLDFAKSNGRSEILPADVDLMVQASIELKIFDLTDTLANKNLEKTTRIFNDFLAADEDISMILSMVVYQIRNMIVVADLIARNDRGGAKSAGIHPFVFQKTLAAVKKTTFTKLRWLYRELAEIDWQIKTGQKEIVPNMTLLFVKFCEDDKMNEGQAIRAFRNP